jgi:hypothetical protein
MFSTNSASLAQGVSARALSASLSAVKSWSRQGFIIDLSEMGVDGRLRGLVTCDGLHDWRFAGLRFGCHLLLLPFRPFDRIGLHKLVKLSVTEIAARLSPKGMTPCQQKQYNEQEEHEEEPPGSEVANLFWLASRRTSACSNRSFARTSGVSATPVSGLASFASGALLFKVLPQNTDRSCAGRVTPSSIKMAPAPV